MSIFKFTRGKIGLSLVVSRVTLLFIVTKQFGNRSKWGCPLVMCQVSVLYATWNCTVIQQF